MLGYVLLMRNEHDGPALLLVQALEGAENYLASLGVEVSGGLIG
jgi:hypothetical protein